MSQSKFKNDFQGVLLQSCFVGHPVCSCKVGGKEKRLKKRSGFQRMSQKPDQRFLRHPGG